MCNSDAEKRTGGRAKRIASGITPIVATLACVLFGGGGPARADDTLSPSYERDIKPLFARRCTVCHRASKRDLANISGGLALDSFDAILAGTRRRKVVVPGRSVESELCSRLADSDEERRMPLDDEPLPLEQQDLVRRWVDAGAPRGVAVALSAGARATASAPDRPRRVRFVRSLEVVLQSDVKLAPNTLNAKKGGALSIALPIGPLPPVTALAFRGDNRLLAVGVYAEVVVWDLRDGQAVQAIAEIPGPVHALAFSRDGRRLAVGAGLPARSGVVQVYSVPDGTKLHDFAGHGDVVTAVALRPDGAQIASASFDQTVRLWSLGRNRPEGVFHGHSDFVHTLAYTPDGRSLLSGGKDRTVKRINPQTLQEERAFSAPDEVLALAVHPDGKRFVSAGNDSEIRWWAYGATKPVSRRGGHSGPVQQLAFSGDGQLLVSAGADGSVRLWSGKTGELRRQLGRGGEWQYAAAISGDGRLAASGGWDGLVRLWDAESGRLRATLVQPPPVTFSPNDETSPQRLDWLAVSPAGYVNGSPELIAMARWRADGDALPAEAVRRVCASADSIARAMRGESLKAVSFTPNAGK